MTWLHTAEWPCNFRYPFSQTFGSSHMHTNNDASIIASSEPQQTAYSGSYLWLKPTLQWMQVNYKDIGSPSLSPSSPSSVSSSGKRRQRQRQQQMKFEVVGIPTPTPITVMTIEEKKREEESKAFKEISSDPNRYSIKYSTYLNYLIVLSDGRWLACWGRTIYWLPIHNHKRMMIAHQHYDNQPAHLTSGTLPRSTIDSIETKIDGYADVFARLPADHSIEEMYPLDGNAYGIASDLFITLVRIGGSPIPTCMISPMVGGVAPPSGTRKLMIWSVTTYDEADKLKKTTIKPLSVWACINECNPAIISNQSQEQQQ
jgi:hypothetical protein